MSQKDKAEGERQPGRDSGKERGGDDARNQGGNEAGISNRPAEEEQANQDALPERGERKGDTHA